MGRARTASSTRPLICELESFFETRMPSGVATTTASVMPATTIGSPVSLIACTFARASSLIQTGPALVSAISSVSVFHVPRSFHVPEYGTTEMLDARSTTS